MSKPSSMERWGFGLLISAGVAIMLAAAFTFAAMAMGYLAIAPFLAVAAFCFVAIPLGGFLILYGQHQRFKRDYK